MGCWGFKHVYFAKYSSNQPIKTQKNNMSNMKYKQLVDNFAGVMTVYCPQYQPDWLMLVKFVEMSVGEKINATSRNKSKELEFA